jgi:hypothetical protein
MRIRPFDARDAHGVAALWQYWFRDKTREPAPGLEALARRIYAERPGAHPAITSLVAEGDGGEMLGFLGVTTTPVLVDGQAATLAGVFPSVVDPDLASTTVASLLLRTFLRGPQAFTLSDGGHVKFERIWETLGGRILQLRSLRWVKTFRPASTAALAFTSAGWRPLRPVALPVAAGADWLARRAMPGRLRAAPPRSRRERDRPAPLVGEPLTPARLLEASERIHAGVRLRPVYDEGVVEWQLREMRSIVEQGELTATLVRDPAGDVAGWYVAYVRPGGVSRVFALEALPRFVDGVVDHLFTQAEAAGAGTLIGRLEPGLRRPLAARGCFVHAGGSLMMVHARDASLMDDAELGRLAFSRLDGENWYWWAIVSGIVPSPMPRP